MFQKVYNNLILSMKGGERMYLKDVFKDNMIRLKGIGYSEEEIIEIFNNGITASELEELIFKNKLKRR